MVCFAKVSTSFLTNTYRWTTHSPYHTRCHGYPGVACFKFFGVFFRRFGS